MTETDRAVRDLGARGIQLFSNINGRPLDEPEYWRSSRRWRSTTAGLAASVSRRGHGRLSHRDAVEVRDLVDIWLAGMRDERRDIDWSSPASSIDTAAQDHHPPPRCHGAGFEPRRARLGSARLADLGQFSRRSCAGCRSGRSTSACSTAIRRSSAHATGRCAASSSAPDTCSLPRRPIRSPEGPDVPSMRRSAILDRLPVSEADRERIYWRNAVELLKLQ